MEGLYPGIAAAVLLLLLVLAVRGGSAPKADPAKRRTWEEVTRRLGGRLFVKEGEFRIRFKWHGLEALLLEKPETTFLVERPGLFARLNLSLEPRSRSRPAGRVDGELLSSHWVCAPDLGTAKEFLTPAVRQLLSDLSREKPPEVTIVTLFEVHVEVKQETDKLVRFVSLCLQLAQHALVFVSRDAGIQVIEASGSSTGLCQICGAELGGQIVSCARCATPHHQDCWEYAGVCSTYGCGSREARS